MNAEAVINAKRKKKEELYAEIEVIESEEQEARAILQLLKGGKVITGTRSLITGAEYLEAIQAISEDKPEFTHHDLSDWTGATPAAASQKVKNLLADGTLVVAQERGPGVVRRKVKLT